MFKSIKKYFRKNKEHEGNNRFELDYDRELNEEIFNKWSTRSGKSDLKIVSDHSDK